MKNIELERKKNDIKDEARNGVGNTSLNEEIPKYNAAESEHVIAGKNNTWIILGRDRPQDIFSGYGGRGFKKSGAIDIVAGRTSAIIKEFDDNQERIYTNSSIPYDASRITISQRTDVDDNFYLPGRNVKNKAAIAIKSDNIRIVSREEIKLVTNSDKYDSNGELKIQKFGTTLIANNGEDLQPIPKGENLEKIIKDLYQKISEQQIAGIMKIIIQILTMLVSHSHPTPTGVAAPSLEIGFLTPAISSDLAQMLIELQAQQLNIEASRAKYLTPGSKDYLNSLFHKLD